jgi:transcriptional regulator of acetoin/glycerol metabolism
VPSDSTTRRDGPLSGSAAILRELLEHDPGAVRCAILRAYLASGGSPEGAAEELGISRRTLLRWVHRLGLAQMIGERWPRPLSAGEGEP